MLRLPSAGSLCAGLPCSVSNSTITSLGKRFTGPARGQPDPAPAINGPPPEVNNDIHCDTETSRVASSISDAGIYISGVVNHQIVPIMLDTGATVSVVSEELWRKCGGYSSLLPVAATLTAANGNQIEVQGQAEVRLRIAEFDILWTVIVARGLSHDCLLGTDFFHQYMCKICYGTGTFMAGSTEVPIRYQKVKPVVGRVVLQSDTEIEPGTERIIGGRLESGFKRDSGSPGVIERMGTVQNNKEICVGHSLVIPKDGDTPVRVANFTDTPIKLSIGHVIGFYHPLSSLNSETTSSQVGVKVSQDSQQKCSNQTGDTESRGKESEEMGAERDSHSKPNIQFDKSDISETKQERFLSMIDQFSDIFAIDNSDLEKTSLREHTIDTGTSQPIKRPPRRTPPHQREIIDWQLDDLLKHGRIEPSQSPWSSPVVIARKYDGTFRMCVDYRRLNECTVKDAQPLHRSDDALEAVGGARRFSCLDLASGYWQTPVAARNRPKTSFSTHTGQFQWKVMPFGLTNGPASLTHLMNLALDGLTWIYCLVYLDDIIVWSATFDEHLHRLRQVFDRIRKAGLRFKSSKCQFLKKRVTFLGHVVSSQGIETDPEKTRVVDEWPTPKNLVGLQSFLGKLLQVVHC